MTLYAVKPRFQAVLERLAIRLARSGVSAHALTACGVGAAAIAGLLLASAGSDPWLLLVPPLLFARIAANALDGMVARLSGSSSRWGTVLNEGGDRVADLLCFGGLLVGAELPPIVEVSLLPLLLLVSYLGILGQAAGGERRYEGPLGKADRMLLLAVYCLVVPLTERAATATGWALLAGLALTAVNRLRALARAEMPARRAVEGTGRPERRGG